AGLAARTRGRVAAYLAGRGSHAAVAALDLSTGTTFAYNAAVRFETASIVKVDILAALLLQRQDEDTAGGEAELTADLRTLATRMITQSDNDAATDLYNQVGDAAGLARANRTLGLRDTTPANSWGLTTTTVADQLQLLRAVSRPGPLAAANRAYILDLMSKVEGDQRWGVPAAAGDHATAVYVKNGWLSLSDDGNLWIINSIGRIVEPGHDWLVVVLSNQNATMDAGIDLVQATAGLALDGLRSA
ncbi:MAG: serine hydrolase, partial [Micromonosporaceae bacterium]|nr:serine hydrolase [Micromonosporaceae bacterium]